MVSRHWLAVVSFTAAQALAAQVFPAQAQVLPAQVLQAQVLPVPAPQAAASGFRPGATANSGPTQPKQPNLVTPEMRGDIFMARKMFREAVEAYQEGPSDSAVLMNKTGIAYHQMLELDLARRYYERALKANPRYPEAINNLGTIYYAHKSYRRAVNQYKKALALSPNSASMYSNLGTGYFARRDYKRASEAWQRALDIDPDVFENHGSRGVLLQERSTDDRARFHYYMAKTYARAGAFDRALQYIRKSLEEGFKDRRRFEEEPEFAGLRENAEFKQLLAMEPRVL